MRSAGWMKSLAQSRLRGSWPDQGGGGVPLSGAGEAVSGAGLGDTSGVQTWAVEMHKHRT